MRKFTSIMSGAVALALLSPTPAAAIQRQAAPGPVQPAFNPCCPPWNSAQLQSMLFYQGSGGIASPYTLKFHPTPLLNAQLNAYINYLHTLGMGFTNIVINFQLINAGTGPTPVPGVLITQQPVSWTGTGNPSPTLFPNNLMVVNHWYRIQTQIILGGYPGQFLPRECITSYVDVRIQVLPSVRSAPRLQFRLANGRTMERALDQ